MCRSPACARCNLISDRSGYRVTLRGAATVRLVSVPPAAVGSRRPGHPSRSASRARTLAARITVDAG